MGRDAGYIALHSGIATGAENILIPESKTDIEELILSLTKNEKRQKLVNLIVVAEGDEFGGANELAKVIKERVPQADTRVCILGHIQRGGSPSCQDRLIASHMGYYAVESLIIGRNNVMVGVVNNKIHYTPLDKAVKEKQKIGQEWMKIVKILAS
jgi:6-phosphofructokinase 1